MDEMLELMNGLTWKGTAPTSYTHCPRCGQMVKAQRKVRAFAFGGQSKIEGTLEALPHNEDVSGWAVGICKAA